MTKHFGYWVFGKDMANVKPKTLKENGITDLFLNYYAFTTHGKTKVLSFIKECKTNSINVHIWVQCFYDGKWHNPKTYDTAAKLKEIKNYAAMENVKGVHLDYLRYPGNAYKTDGGADAITAFVKKVRSQNPNTFLSCAIMPESENKKYYGQDITALGKIVDAVLPMQYKGNYGQGTSWLNSTTKQFSKDATIWSGLQTYKSDDDTTQLSSKELLNDSKTCLSAGAKGVVLFRYGISPTVNFTSLQDTTSTTVTSKGLSATNIKTLATNMKKYLETNKKLPQSITINKVEYTWPQIWYIFAWAVNNLNKNLNSVPNVKTSDKATGDKVDEKIYPSDFKDQSKRVVQYIKQKGKAPNYVISVKSQKKISPRLSIDALSRILVYYFNHKNVLPDYCTYDSSKFTSTSSSSKSNNNSSSTKNNCTNPYTSSPHYTNQGAGALGQITPYDCGPHCIHQGLKKFGVTNISESELMAYCGTTTSGTSHEGINTGIAKAAKKAGIKIKVEWKNFSDLGKTEAERFKALGELICKKNVFAFCHLWYSCAGECIDDDDACGHYEAADKVNIKTGYIRALNSLGARQGNGYYGHLQDRKFSIQSHYIAGISQKSICIMTKV